eukprot:CAMPEP_0204401950 /NCGR_PEP_ID=MMETSP0470-20130426/5001_1 /ASSEMBLY_ACC=CAM_ASM_000385 /TAXON_ID=2969 /ORGANISM="Oxyrrhis marina" /LENGTH=88 /DNA_ID=CAMNT_0051396975 /DNA_START=292 /DNA_END=558 /DNA_ORIENTATION=+
MTNVCSIPATCCRKLDPTRRRTAERPCAWGDWLLNKGTAESGLQPCRKLATVLGLRGPSITDTDGATRASLPGCKTQTTGTSTCPKRA